jgi:hypothetical protein
MIIEGEEGVTHINVYSKSKTELGKWLSNFTYAPIELDEGKFDSIEGYWYWLRCFDNRLKTMSGFAAKQLGKQLQGEFNHTPENFEEKIKKSIDVKLKTYLDKSKKLCESNLPLCHYYEYGGKRVDAGSNWIIKHIEFRRSMLREYFGKNK